MKLGALLLKNEYPGVLQRVERGENRREATSLEQQLHAFKQLRNDIAHAETGSAVDPNAAKRPDHIVFVYYEDGQRRSKSLTLADAQAREKEWMELFNRLSWAANKIAKHRAPSRPS